MGGPESRRETGFFRSFGTGQQETKGIGLFSFLKGREGKITPKKRGVQKVIPTGRKKNR